MLNSDLGSQNGPMIRPSVYEELVAPYMKKLCKFIHENSDFKIMLHSCGGVEPLIPILVDCGIDILNPVQISANGMEPGKLVQKYGKDIVFWGGGCDTQSVLNLASPQEVESHVKDLMGIYKNAKGYVFNQVHNIMGDIKSENVVAMFDAAYKFGKYV